MKFERKFGKHTYKAVYVEWTSLDKGYGGESASKERALKKARALRDAGFSGRVCRETHTRYPKRGPEVFFVVYARKDGLTLDQVEAAGRKMFG